MGMYCDTMLHLSLPSKTDMWDGKKQCSRHLLLILRGRENLRLYYTYDRNFIVKRNAQKWVYCMQEGIFYLKKSIPLDFLNSTNWDRGYSLDRRLWRWGVDVTYYLYNSLPIYNCSAYDPMLVYWNLIIISIFEWDPRTGEWVIVTRLV